MITKEQVLPLLFKACPSIEKSQIWQEHIKLWNDMEDRGLYLDASESAYKGIVKGVVRIVRKVGHIQKVQQGDILVSPMTTPDFLPAMHRAAAFVTDEGGITCHAAIVAREMKKPCIIGTKTATEMLKDGDLVEVDANKGLVKII